MDKEKNTKYTKTAGGVVVNPKGEVIVVQQRSSSWSLPKGHLKKGEDNLAAAKREIYEESGITNLELIEDLGNYQRYKGGNDESEMKTIFMFLFKTNNQVLKPIDSNNPQAKWVKKDEVVDSLTHQQDKDFFLEIIDKI